MMSSSPLGQQLVLQLALVSTRNSLAFWRQQEVVGGDQPEPASSSAAASSSNYHLYATLNRPKSSLAAKCPQLSSYFISALASSSIANKQTTIGGELLAVEGSSITINFVILGSRFQVIEPSSVNQASQKGMGFNNNNNDNNSGFKLNFRWLRNDQPLPVSLKGQTSRHSNGRFIEQVFNENDIMRRYFANIPVHEQSSTSNNSTLSKISQSKLSQDSFQPFLLAPFMNEQQLSRLRMADERQFSTNLKSILRWYQKNSQQQQQQQQQQTALIDDFLNDGQSIDWQKLESYLRHNAQSMHLYLPTANSNSDDLVRNCPVMPLNNNQIEQLTIVQLEANHLRMEDAGLYTLEACSSASCQSVAFRLHLAQDFPILEHKFEHQILEVGDRLSIKCEANGFTLPQITWFLDGQQLNEHKQLKQRTSPASDQSNMRDEIASNEDGDEIEDILLSTSGSLQHQHQRSTTSYRVGDYVSPNDNHVHSFVNSSSVQVTDGGLYRCQANNGFHSVDHEARIDVRGPVTFARLLGNLSVLSGQMQLHIQCPFSGYPISTIEWFFKGSIPQSQPGVQQQQQQQQQSSLVMPSVDDPDYGPSKYSSMRLKRTNQLSKAYLDDREPDPESDEWLSQASAITPPEPEDYPDPLPDYPPSSLDEDNQRPYYGDTIDYSDQQMDFQQQQQLSRKRRDLAAESADWVKLPQSRRHQVYRNGTLVIEEISRQDQGFYKCRVGQISDIQLAQQQAEPQAHGTRVASSNEFYLNVLVPPVISPFASANSLREGMRNFLTCSVIEGDSPVKITWFKDDQTIEDYISNEFLQIEDNEDLINHRLSSSMTTNPVPDVSSNSDETYHHHHRQQQQQQQRFAATNGGSGGRIRVETSNEYTSTLYFSHVDFKDNGNYTCMATNKAASVNYTAKMLVNVPPKWIKAPKDVECTSGQNIVIDCQAKAYPSARVWWEIGSSSGESSTTNSSSSISNGSSSNNNNKSYTRSSGQSHHQLPDHSIALQHPPIHYRTIVSNSRIHTLENASLVIRDVQQSDQGYYLCQAANNFGSLSSLIRLTVNVGASFSSKYLLKYAKLGERIELDCDPIGQSPIEVTWFMRHHQQQLASLTSTLSSQTSQATNMSTSNWPQTTSALGQRLFAGLVQTEQQPAIKSSSGYSQKHHQPLTLDGSSPSSPEALTSYSLANGKISFEILRKSPITASSSLNPSSSHNYNHHLNPQQATEIVRLIIEAATRQHSAEFICKATNKYGSDEKLIKLLVQEAPDQVRDLQPLQVDSRSISLNWPIPFNGNAPIQSYTVEWSPIQVNSIDSPDSRQRKWSQIIVQQPSATITSLKPLTSYEIKVRAQNQFGLSPEVTSPLVVTSGEEAPNGPPSDIQATPISSSSIQLTWLAPKQLLAELAPGEKSKSPSIKGYYLGYKVINGTQASSSQATDSFVFKTVPLNEHAQQSFRQMDTDLSLLPVSIKQDPSEQQSNRTSTPSTNNQVRVVIGDLKRATKYAIIVQAFNSAGPGPQSDQIETRTLLNDPPPTPMLRVGLVTYSSIELQWFHLLGNNFDSNRELNFQQADTSSIISSAENNTVPLETGSELIIDGFQLYYRSTTQSQTGAWQEKKLMPDSYMMIDSSVVHSRAKDLTIVPNQAVNNNPMASNNLPAAKFQLNLTNDKQGLGWQRNSSSMTTFKFILDQLICGNSYQIYLVAFNSIGSSQPSQIIRTKTRGSTPIAPRRQDFLAPNSTLTLLNLDSWMDGGCSISNFEIRYKQLKGSRSNNQQPQLEQEISTWLLVSNQLSPEQRVVELHDLQPETWYSVWVIAESVAGKSEAQYTFMTLDKFGRLPLEALESNAGSNALFGRYSNGSLRSLLYNFSSSASNSMSPLLISACLALILFASCSLILIKRYNDKQHLRRADSIKDNTSIDSRTACSLSVSTHYHHNQAQLQRGTQVANSSNSSGISNTTTNNGIIGFGPHQVQTADHHLHQQHHNHHPHHHQHSMSFAGRTIDDSIDLSSSKTAIMESPDYGNCNNINGAPSSPCKTSTTILTGSSHSTSNASSSTQGNHSMCGPNVSSFRPPREQQQQQYPYTHQQQLDLSRFIGDVNTDNHYIPAQFNTSTLAQCQQQAFRDSADSPVGGTMKLPVHISGDLMQRFKTMPHQRAVQGQQQSSCPSDRYSGYYSNNHQSDEYNEQQLVDQQQIYSKLRLMQCNNNGYYPEQQAKEYHHQQAVFEANDSINLSVLSQQHQKMLASCTLKRAQTQPTNCAAGTTAVGVCNLDPTRDQLTSMMVECPSQQQNYGQQPSHDTYASQLQAQQQQYVGCIAPAESATVSAENGSAYGAYGASSVISGSTSTNTNGSSQPADSNQISAQQQQQEQLISLTSEVNAIGNQCSKSSGNQQQILNQTKINSLNGCANQQQQSLMLNNTGVNNEPTSDYALPFPPKWV